MKHQYFPGEENNPRRRCKLCGDDYEWMSEDQKKVCDGDMRVKKEITTKQVLEAIKILDSAKVPHDRVFYVFGLDERKKDGRYTKRCLKARRKIFAYKRKYEKLEKQCSGVSDCLKSPLDGKSPS